MQARIQALFEGLDASRADLKDAVDQVPVTRRQERPAPDRWSVAEVLEHLGIVETRIAHLFRSALTTALAEGVGPEVETEPVEPFIDPDRLRDRGRPVTTSAASRPTGAIDAATAWTRLEEARAALRAAIMEGDGLALTEVAVPHAVFGPLDLYQWIVFAAGHEARHAGQIREIHAQLTGR
jgi:hypothetical protein